MDEPSLIDKISKESQANIIGTIMLSSFIVNDKKTWNREKPKCCFPNYVTHKIMNIFVPISDILDKPILEIFFP